MTQPLNERKGRFSAAFADYRALILLGVGYIAVVCAEAYLWGLPLAELFKFIRVSIWIISRLVLVLLLTGGFYFACRLFDNREMRAGRGRIDHAWHRLDKSAELYFSGGMFAYAVAGFFAVLPLDFFFIQKSLLHFVNPYSWDVFFARLDRIIHLGTTPNAWFMELAQKFFFIGRILDFSYLLWFGVMFACLAYNLLGDRDIKRRVRYLWVFVLSWIILGSLMAGIFSSVGPIFYHYFYPRLPDPYAALRAYMNQHGINDFPIAYTSRKFLLIWAWNGKLINPNAITAFPSMHMAIAWLNALYCYSFKRSLGVLAFVFSVFIFGATMLTGFHYGVDIYVSVIAVSIMWRVSTIIADRVYGKNNFPQIET